MSAKEWMRICFELLELLKAHKKAIRRATVNTFGYIAKAIGPHDVLATLLNNLRVSKFSAYMETSALLDKEVSARSIFASVVINYNASC